MSRSPTQRSGRARVELGTAERPGSSLSAFHDGRLKRAFDIVGSLFFLVLSAPLFALVALAIKLDSRGPILFRQTRLGRGGKPFEMLKFRKMPIDLTMQGPMLTRLGDPRLTPVGRWLGWTKLDELPQFINVLRGDMSLIGPRPEVPAFVDREDPRWQIVLSVRPGIFGVNQILARNESERYPHGHEDLEGFYRQHILPAKLEIDAEYVRRAGLMYDLGILVQGVMAAFFGTVTGSGVRSHAAQILMLLLDIAASMLSLAVAFYVHASGDVPPSTIPGFWPLLALTAVCRTFIFLVMGVYRRRLHTLTYSDFLRIIQSILYGSTLVLLLAPLVADGIPRSVLLFDTLCLGALLLSKAYGIHQLLRSRETSTYDPFTPAAIALVGAATALNVAAFLTLIRWWEQHELTKPSTIQFTGLILGFATIRAYGFCHYGLVRPSTGRSLTLFDLRRVLPGVLVGSLFVYMGDTMLYTSLVTFPVLFADLALSTAIMLILNRTVGLTGEDRGGGRARRPVSPSQRILLVGIGPEIEFYLSFLESIPPPKPLVLGIIDNRQGRPRTQTINNVEVVGTFGHLGAFLEVHTVDEVVYFPSALEPRQVVEAREVCATYSIPVHAFPDLRSFAAAEHPKSEDAPPRETLPSLQARRGLVEFIIKDERLPRSRRR